MGRIWCLQQCSQGDLEGNPQLSSAAVNVSLHFLTPETNLSSLTKTLSKFFPVFKPQDPLWYLSHHYSTTCSTTSTALTFKLWIACRFTSSSPSPGSARLGSWVLDALAAAELSPLVCNVLRLGSTFLPVQVEDMERGSAHDAARPLRQVIYALLPGTARAAAPRRQQANKLPGVCEFGRIQKTIEKRFVQAASLPADFCVEPFPLERLREQNHIFMGNLKHRLVEVHSHFGNSMNLLAANEVCSLSFCTLDFFFHLQVPISCRLMLLLETLGVKKSILESVPSHLQLPFAVTCYWIHSSEPKVKLHQLKALLLMIVSGELHSTTQDTAPTDLSFEGDSIVYKLFPKEKEQQLENMAFDLDAAHSFCQWQCCLQMGFHLNQLLGSPLAEPDISRIYNGTLVQRLCQEFKSSPSAENFISTPKMTQFYQDLLDTVQSTVPPDFFQEKPQTKAKRRRKKKVCNKTKALRAAPPETQPFCDLNSFALLGGEN
ncbi:PREDICTED: protein asteroid homolog 1 [Tinamus guttatus]|uniref:protein asteroid homolog 1 n=1 Tax=Tinamus guttatus TaxID=94827 RepID=UPI00052F3B53|nr:PREDICTED: protein asteroid homolog 1 [Tinamus guttatus]